LSSQGGDEQFFVVWNGIETKDQKGKPRQTNIELRLSKDTWIEAGKMVICRVGDSGEKG